MGALLVRRHVRDTLRTRPLGTCGEEAQHCAGTRLAASVTVLSDSVSGGVRTVEMSRPLRGRTDDHYSFSLAANTTLNLITAVGYSHAFGHHKARHHSPHISPYLPISPHISAYLLTPLGTTRRITTPRSP